MAEKSQSQQFIDMFTKLGQDLKLPSVDVQKLVEHHRKNLEALEKSAKVASTGASTMMSKQREIIESTLREMTDMARGFGTGTNPQELVSKQADLAKRTFEAALSNTREMAEIVQKSGSDVFKIMQDRMRESLQEIQASFEKKK